MELKKALSPLEAEMNQMSELLSVEQDEIDTLIGSIEIMYKRLIVKMTDAEGITCWETEYGIIHNNELTLEERRAQVLAKINSGIPATKEMLENLVKQVISANSVRIVEYPEEYRFEIYVGTDCFEEHMDIADAAVDKARPAHLAYKFINLLYRKYRCRLYIGVTGCTRKTKVSIIDTRGLDIDKLRCRLHIGVIGCISRKMKGMVG